MRTVSTANRKALLALPLVTALLWVGTPACEPTLSSDLWVNMPETTISVRRGEEDQVVVRSNGLVVVEAPECSGLAEVTATTERVKVRGLAPGHCVAQVSVVRQFQGDVVDQVGPMSLDITVFDPNIPDAGQPDATSNPGDAEAGIPALCRVPVAKVANQNGRDLFMAYTDVDSGEPNQACPIHTSTDFRGDIVFSFLSGSPGYSIDGRGTYVIESASPATLQNTEWTSSATALEGDVITMKFKRRVFDDEDASIPPSTWTMTFRMAPDPDYSKWEVELYSFSKE